MKKSTLTAVLGCAAFFATAVSGLAQIPTAWTQRYNAPPDNTDESRSVAVDNSGNVFVTGYAFNGNGNLDAVTIKYNPAGILQWVKNYDRGVNDNDQGVKVTVDAAGNAYMVGTSRGATSGVDILVVKYDPAGTELWASHYNGITNASDEGKSIGVDASGNVYVCGYETSSGFTFDMVTIKYNSSGAQQWANVYNGTISGN
ncbi:MAG: SBBP repeat-containing protein, partial [Bacteroidia bacterium]